jgi:hypothetical protein
MRYAAVGASLIAHFFAVVLATVTWSGAPAAHLSLDARSLGVAPDGAARFLVRALFTDKRGRATTPLKGGNVDFVASRGEAQWQTRLRFNAPSAVISVTEEGPSAIDVRTDEELGSLSARATIEARLSARLTHVRRRKEHSGPSVRRGDLEESMHVVGAPLGPHLVQIGWFPRQLVGTTQVVRSGPGGSRVVGLVGSPSSTYRDASVVPGVRYRYRIVRKGRPATELTIDVPPEPPSASIRAVAGKGMWLTFSPDVRDDDAYTVLDPKAIVDRAVHAGLHFIELRTAYGPYWEITPEAKPVIDALIDRAAEHGVGVVGWTVPRSAAFDDLALSVATATYSTPHGNHLAGLAIDLERGEAFMGDGARGYAALVDYPRLLRAALGRSYPLIATIEDPFIEHLTNKQFPYAAIAANTDVLQPMVYWSALSRYSLSPAAVRAAIARSYDATMRAAHRRIAINVGGQTTPLGGSGAPLPEEITASLEASRRSGALGETFFAWNGTLDGQWEAVAGYHW